jgi:hypothetical protein
VLVRVVPRMGTHCPAGVGEEGMEAKLHACTQQRGRRRWSSAGVEADDFGCSEVTVNRGAWRLAGTVVGTMDGAGCYKFFCTS